jgi:Mg-chelatase subunit ChlD
MRTDRSEHGAFLLRIGERRVAVRPGHDVVLGCDPLLDVVLIHATVSPRHARFRSDGVAVAVTDLGSEAGTFVNGVRVRSAVVRPGDRIAVGSIPLELTLSAVTPLAEIVRQLQERAAPFEEIMRRKLAAAPCLALSTLVHGLLLLLLWWLAPAPPEETGAGLSLAVARPEVRSEEPLDLPVEEPEDVEVTELTEPPQIHEPTTDFALGESAGPEAELGPGTGPRGDLMDTGLAGFGGGARSMSQGFRRTVATLRRSGLEVAFVIDSTGSMSGVLHDVKRTVLRMNEVLSALVPGVRIGVVAYRDEGDAYVTRTSGLARDLYATVNFVDTVQADGGGDVEEAILAGLAEAFGGLPWTAGAKQVVVLIGDAPPHGHETAEILRKVRSFATRGVVHALYVDSADQAVRDVFQKMAKAGRGQCGPVEDGDTIMRQMLTLAFGQEFRSDIDEAWRTANAKGGALAGLLERRLGSGDVSWIAPRFRVEPVPSWLAGVVARSRSRAAAAELLAVLEDPGVPEAGRQAALYAVRRILDLPRGGDGLSRRSLDSIRRVLMDGR